MKRMKYIRHKKYGIILFPDNGIDDPMHTEMASRMGFKKIISAGFVDIENLKMNCYGFSVSLNMGPMDEDSDILNGQLGL